MPRVSIYDTTLRDGSQGEGVSFSLPNKLEAASVLDSFGVDYIEGGWPLSNPKDMDFFREVAKRKWRHARVAAFGSTRHANNKPEDDPNLRCLVECKASVATIFGKSWDLHVTDALRVSLQANLDMIASSVAFLKKRVGTVFYDAEHFFDGYRANPEYALKTLDAAANAGAACLILCDTNGGSLPGFVTEALQAARKKLGGDVAFGIHPHNDSGLAVANAIAAIQAGATHVQGTINGIGERCGNCDLTSVIPVLELKLGLATVGREKLRQLTEVSRHIYELANVPLLDRQPFVGRSAFAHKGGVHVSAIARNKKTYEHVSPEDVGNERRILISELSGRSNIMMRSKVDLSSKPQEMKAVLDQLMKKEREGYTFESADASFDLLVRRTLKMYKPFFALKGFRVSTEMREGDERASEATVKVEVGGELMHTACDSVHGPVSALDGALRKALLPHYPQLSEVRLVDYKVVIVDPDCASQAHVRVTIESADHNDVWTTVGASVNIIEATYLALVDSIEHKLLKKAAPAKAARASARKK